MAIAHLPALRAASRPIGALLAAAALTSTTVLASCVSIIQHPLQMTYHSDPEGATLYQGNTRFGYTPLMVTYQDASRLFRAGTCLPLQPVQVRWASGAAATATNLKACPAQGYSQQYSFLRPLSAPGADVDASFAVQIQRNGILQQQSDAQEASAIANYLKTQDTTRAVAH
jgi:hypothetical protein